MLLTCLIVHRAYIFSFGQNKKAKNHQKLIKKMVGLLITYLKKCKVLPGLEPGLQGSEPWVLTNYTVEPDLTSSSIQKKNARKVESNHWDVGPPWI